MVHVLNSGLYQITGDDVAVCLPDFVQIAFERRGHQHYGEDLTQSAHMLQCAYKASQAGEPETVVIAALLHDFGHLIEDAEQDLADGIDAEHEALGAAFLSRYFPPSITRPIALHVAAKRHLCRVEPGYLDRLSAASLLTLKLQGGPFTQDQADAFKADPFSAEAIRLRRYDECGKAMGLDVPDLEFYAPMLARNMIAAD